MPHLSLIQHSRIQASFAFCWLACLTMCGCKKKAEAPPEPPPPVVYFVNPVTETVVQHEEFSGRTTSSKTVDILARVSGYLSNTNFKDGDEVQEKQVLFEIEDETFLALEAQAEANMKQAEAHWNQLKTRLERAENLRKIKNITQEEYDTLKFETQEAKAANDSAISARELAKINVKYTKVRAPFAGRINRRQLDPGGLVKADTTVLATIVAPTPIFGYFDFDERTVLHMRRLVEQGKLKAAPDFEAEVQIALAGEEDFTLQGKINWVDNQIDLGTGTLRARVHIDNPKGTLSPGMFVRLKVPVGPKEPALLIPEEALGSDQGQRFVYIINAEDKIEYRRVEGGWLTEGRRVIRSGLKPDDRVVVTGLQRVRPKALVKPEPYKKPSSVPAAEPSKTDTVKESEKESSPGEKASVPAKTTSAPVPNVQPVEKGTTTAGN